MSIAVLRCLGCDQHLHVNYGGSLPLCWSCLLNTTPNHRVSQRCVVCGQAKGDVLNDSLVCEDCYQRRAQGLRSSRLFCRVCGESRSVADIAAAGGYSESAVSTLDVPFAAMLCTACSRAMVDHGFGLGADGSIQPPSDHGASCFVDAARRSALSGHSLWQARLSPVDMQRLEDITQGEHVSCVASLIAGTTNQLPSHVCLRTAMTTCDLTFRGYGDYFARCGLATAGSESDTTQPLAEAFVLPRIMEEIWSENGYAPWPVPLSLHLLVGLVVHRSCPEGTLTLLAPMTLADNDTMVFDEPLIHVHGDRSSLALQAVHKELIDWYHETILGQRVIRRGRPVGSSVLLSTTLEHFDSAVRAAGLATGKTNGDLTPSDIVAQLELLMDDPPSPSTLGRWLRQRKVRRPD